MYLLLFLIGFPLFMSLLLLVTKNSFLRRFLVITASLLLSLAVLLFFSVGFRTGIHYFELPAELLNRIIFLAEIAVSLLVLWIGLKNKKPLIVLMVLLQAGLLFYFELNFGHALKVQYNLFVDKFSIIMALIVGIVGSLISFYSLGYMEDFHHHNHTELKDKQNFFFFIVYLFTSAMFGIIFSNNLLWLYFFWEITTLCSYLLIGYKETPEANNNALLALTLNLLGGLAFAGAIVWGYFAAGTIELDKLLLAGHEGIMIPIILLSLSGLTKSAQMPFSSWLLGAMVAPTPVSALLHSSTMVKAGVYLLVKLAPVLQGTFTGNLVAFIGGLTFLFASLIAVTQRDAKKVLAYSTIANLGLIVVCAGIGTYEAVWAAILLIIFHALAKALLFLSVGLVEHKINSRDIEDMDGLIVTMPRSAWMLLIGMAGMFLAPFGMLISKWAALKALIDAHTVLIIPVVYGGAATLLFWVKWMGKILAVTGPRTEKEDGVHFGEWLALYGLAGLTMSICLLFPLASSLLVEPYVIGIYGYVTTIMSRGNIIIMLIMLGMVILFPFSLPGPKEKNKVKIVGPYLGGANLSEDLSSFEGSLGRINQVRFKNYYLEKYLGEKVLFLPATVFALLVLLMMLVQAGRQFL